VGPGWGHCLPSHAWGLRLLGTLLADKQIKSTCTCYNISTVSSKVGDEAKSEIRADRAS
jgi:hypothetical protein